MCNLFQVIDKAPGHTKALLDLSFVLRQLKQFREALQVNKNIYTLKKFTNGNIN